MPSKKWQQIAPVTKLIIVTSFNFCIMLFTNQQIC
jgi:hypothetical protein